MNFKSYSKSHKLKKRIPTTKEQQAIFFNTHEAIVDDAVFERVQELMSNTPPPQKQNGRDYFPAWYTVPAVEVNYILLLVKVSTVHKTITTVQSTRAIREAVQLTLSVRKC